MSYRNIGWHMFILPIPLAIVATPVSRLACHFTSEYILHDVDLYFSNSIVFGMTALSALIGICIGLRTAFQIHDYTFHSKNCEKEIYRKELKLSALLIIIGMIALLMMKLLNIPLFY